MSEISVDRIVDDIVDNFKDITGCEIVDVFSKDSESPVFDDAAVDASFDKIKDYVMKNYDVDIATYNGGDILYALDAKLADEFSHDPDFDLTESTWAEKTYKFSASAEKKLDLINEFDLWDDMHDEIDDNPLTADTITGVYVDMYRTVSPAYSDKTEDEIAKGRKELFKIINKYYEMAKAEQPVDDESINESLTPKEGHRVRCVNYMSTRQGMTGTVTGKIGELCWVTWDDGTKSTEIQGFLTVIKNDEVDESAKREYAEEKKYVVIDNSNLDSSDNTRTYTRDETIDLLKKIIEIEQMYLDETKLDYVKRSREDREFNFDLDNLSDDELVDWFKEFDFTVIDANECPTSEAAERCFY